MPRAILERLPRLKLIALTGPRMPRKPNQLVAKYTHSPTTNPEFSFFRTPGLVQQTYLRDAPALQRKITAPVQCRDDTSFAAGNATHHSPTRRAGNREARTCSLGCNTTTSIDSGIPAASERHHSVFNVGRNQFMMIDNRRQCLRRER